MTPSSKQDNQINESAETDYITIIILCVIILLSMGLRLTFLHEPFDRDEGWYAYIAQEILRGSLPYRDLLEMKPPGGFYIYSAAISIFGHTVEGIRIFTAIYAQGTLLAVYWLASRCGGKVAGIIASLIFAIISADPILQGSSSNLEVFMILPLVLSAASMLKGLDNCDCRFMVLSGLMSATALMIKPAVLPAVLLIIISTIFHSRGQLRQLAAYAGSLAAPWMILFLYLFANGILNDFFQWVVVVPYSYASGKTGITGPTITILLTNLRQLFTLSSVISIPVFFYLIFRHKHRDRTFAALLLPAALAGALLPGKNFPHYFIQVTPFLAVLTGIGSAIFMNIKGWNRIIASSFLAGSLVWYTVSIYPYYFLLSPKEVSVAKFGADFTQSEIIAKYIKERTGPKDYLFQWGFQPELYFLTGLRAPLPYVMSIYAPFEREPDKVKLKLIQSLLQTRPTYIVYQPEWAYFPGREQVENFISKEYHLETQIAYALIFRRNN